MAQASARVAPEQAFGEFAANIRGRIIRPGDDGYEIARKAYNGAIDCHPRLVVQCADVADVIHCVNFARTQGLVRLSAAAAIVPRGFGTCNDGAVIDLGRLA
jgi:FAD/FMN-containing dehydrogenase